MAGLEILSYGLSQIRGRSGLRRIISNTGWLFAENLLGLVAGFLVGAWVARYLGPTQYGLFSYALAFGAIFAPIARLGLANITIREFVRAPQDRDAILGTAFVLELAAGLLTLGLICITSYIVRPQDPFVRRLVAIVSGYQVAGALGNTVGYWFQSQTQAKYIVWPRMIALVMVALVKIALVVSGATLIAFAWATLAQSALFTLSTAFLYYWNGFRLRIRRANLSRAWTLLQDSWPLMSSGLSLAVYMRIGQIIMGNLVGEEALGVYSVAVRLSELWYFIPSAVATSVFPTIVRSRETQTKEIYQKRLQAFYDVMVGVAYVVIVPCVVFASPLVSLLFGHQYAGAGPILAVYIWAFVFVSLGGARDQWLIAENMTRFSMLSTILGAVVNIALCYLLIPRYAGLGAAWATLVSYAVSGYLSALLSKRYWSVFGQLSLSLLVPFRLGSLWRALRGIIEVGN